VGEPGGAPDQQHSRAREGCDESFQDAAQASASQMFSSTKARSELEAFFQEMAELRAKRESQKLERGPRSRKRGR
jgi:hypothetical protein